MTRACVVDTVAVAATHDVTGGARVARVAHALAGCRVTEEAL